MIKRLIFFLLIFNIAFVADALAASNPYTQSGPYGTNCTWYAWQMAYEKAGVTLPGFGNAKEWYDDAKRAGYTVGTQPKANSIIVWGGWTEYGHVGYVEKIEGNTLYVWDSTGPCIDKEDPTYKECMANSVNEDTDKLCKANAKEAACEYTISPDYYGITGYIYLDYAPTSLPSQNNTSTSSNNEGSSSANNDTKNEEIIKSSNANLSEIKLSAGNINFAKDVLKYQIEVENEVNKINVEAVTEDEKSTVTGTGEYDLSVGLNEIKLVVKAEDGSTLEYLIEVTRDEEKYVEKEETENITPTTNNNLIISVIIFTIIIVISLIVVLKIRKKK